MTEKTGTLKKTIGWVSGFLFDGESAGQKRPSSPMTGAYAAKTERGAGEATSGGPSPGKLAAGSLQLIGLDALRSALGAEWDARRDRVHRAVEGVLRRRLDVTDAFYRVQGDNYLVLFTRLNRLEAQFKTRVISAEIQKLIMGDTQDSDSLIVTYRVTEVDRKLVLEKTESPEEMMIAVQAAADQENAPQERASNTPDTEVEPQPNLSALFKGVSAEQYIRTRMAAFRPMLDVKTLKFTSFMTTTEARNDRPARPDESLHLVEDPEALPALLDRFLLDASMMGLHRVLQASYKIRIVVPITYETLAGKQLRDAYFTRLKTVPSGLKDFIAFRISDVPLGIPPNRLAEILALLKPLSGAQIIHVPLDPALVDTFAPARCPAFSADLPETPKDATAADVRLRAFAKHAAAQGAATYIGGVDTPAKIRASLSAGASSLHGNAIGACVSSPGPINVRLKI